MALTRRCHAAARRPAWTRPRISRWRVAGILIVALAPIVAGCGRASGKERPAAADGDAVLRERDTALLREVDALTARCAPAWRIRPGCLELACQLRTRELGLFADVRAHEFTDINESNYWHRGRLKFPGDLEQLLRRLAEESPPSGPPCAAAGTPGEPPAKR